jgi:hypothetical protein
VFTDCYLNTDSKCKPKYTLLIIVGAMLFEQIFFFKGIEACLGEEDKKRR